MEPIAIPSQNRSRLLKRISYISLIMKYYGYIHEWAELFKQLCKDSKQEWDKNQRAIVEVIMKHQGSRMNLDVHDTSSHKVFEYLLTNNKFNYYSISLTLERGESFKIAMKFLDEVIRRNKSLNIKNTKIFNSVKIECKGVLKGLVNFVK